MRDTGRADAMVHVYSNMEGSYESTISRISEQYCKALSQKEGEGEHRIRPDTQS